MFQQVPAGPYAAITAAADPGAAFVEHDTKRAQIAGWGTPPPKPPTAEAPPAPTAPPAPPAAVPPHMPDCWYALKSAAHACVGLPEPSAESAACLHAIAGVPTSAAQHTRTASHPPDGEPPPVPVAPAPAPEEDDDESDEPELHPAKSTRPSEAKRTTERILPSCVRSRLDASGGCDDSGEEAPAVSCDARFRMLELRRAAPLFASALACLLGAAVGRRMLATLSEPVPEVLAALRANTDPETSTKPIARRVVCVLIDGLGRAPLEALVDQGMLGAVPWHARLDSGAPSLSRPAYHALLTGVPQAVSGIRHNPYARARADSVPRRVHDAGGKVAFLLDGVPWFHELFAEPGDLFVEGATAREDASFRRALGTGAALVIVHLTGPDGAGHDEGASSAAYARAARAAFLTVASFRAVAAERDGGDDLLWVIGADHGHTATGGHGGPERSVRDITWIALGRGVEARSFDDSAPIGVIAPTIAAAMALPSPRESLVAALPLTGAPETADSVARARRVTAVGEALATHAHAMSTRKLGAAIAIALLLASATRVVGVRRSLRAAAPTVGALAAFVAFGPGLTLSSVATETSFVVKATAIAAMGAAIAWALARGDAPWTDASIAAGIVPATALALTLGSTGRSAVSDAGVLLYPATGIVPLAVTLGALVAAGAMNAVRPNRTRGTSSA